MTNLAGREREGGEWEWEGGHGGGAPLVPLLHPDNSPKSGGGMGPAPKWAEWARSPSFLSGREVGLGVDAGLHHRPL